MLSRPRKGRAQRKPAHGTLCQLAVAAHGYGSVLADIHHYGRH